MANDSAAVEELKMKQDSSFLNYSLSLAFVKNDGCKNIYPASEGKAFAISFEKALQLFKASKNAEIILPLPYVPYIHGNRKYNSQIRRELKKKIRASQVAVPYYEYRLG